MALANLSLLIPLGYDNHIIRITQDDATDDALFHSNVSLEALAVGASSDVDQFLVRYRSGLPGAASKQPVVVGVGAPLSGLILGAEAEDPSNLPIVFSQTRVPLRTAPVVAFFTGTGSKRPELHMHCFFQKPPFVPITRSRDFFQQSLAVTAPTQLFRRPFYGRSRLAFFAKAQAASDPVTFTLRGYKFDPLFFNSPSATDLFVGTIPPAGGVLNFNMQNQFFDAVECVADSPNNSVFYAVEIADGPTG